MSKWCEEGLEDCWGGEGGGWWKAYPAGMEAHNCGVVSAPVQASGVSYITMW